MEMNKVVLEKLAEWVIRTVDKKDLATPGEVEALPKVAAVFFNNYSTSLFRSPVKMGNKEMPFARIMLANIQFGDSHEQQKFERLKAECEKKAAEQLENLLKHQKFTISFE